jgi:hypothetical protein
MMVSWQFFIVMVKIGEEYFINMQKKLLLYITIVLLIFVLYTGFGTQPDIVLAKINGYNWGINVTSNIYLKLLCFAFWMLYFLYDERDY